MQPPRRRVWPNLVLPAAGWGEKDGVLINSERRLGLAKKVARAPGQALSDFAIFQLVANAWGCGEIFGAWSSPEAAFQILKKLSRDQPCDFSGIRDYAHLDQEGGIQWPLPESEVGPARERRLFADGKFFTPDARARFFFDARARCRSRPTPTIRFLLLTGRGTLRNGTRVHAPTRAPCSANSRRPCSRSKSIRSTPPASVSRPAIALPCVPAAAPPKRSRS